MGEFDGALQKLGSMSGEELKDLCARLREKIIETVNSNGGHLASNLGVVELTVGLYTVLDPFRDKVVWDVGHQCYAHKLLTGREYGFETLRKSGGLSGFPSASESGADAFETGHSSTSISAALGFARAKKITGETYDVCAVIGDGAFGSGMVFEALNDAGQSGEDVIVILNDNGMSISPNVGALHKYLIRLRSGRGYIKAKGRVKRFLDKLKGFGAFLERNIQRVKSLMRSAVVPEGELFIELGWKYIGPIDGHDIKAVADAVEKAKMIGGPVIIHAITQKGKGYAPAEENPSYYHGISPDGGKVTAPASFSSCLGETLCLLGRGNDKITAVCAAMVGGTGLSPFSTEFPERYFDVGIAEEHAVTMAAAMARSGLKPFVCLYSTFSQRAYDQMLHDIAQPGNGVVMCLDRGGASGPDGRTHQGIYDLSFLNAMPGFVVAAPADTYELEMTARLAARSEAPFAIRYPAKVPALYSNIGSFPALETSAYLDVEPGRGFVVFDSVSVTDATDGPDYSSRAPVVFMALGVTVYEALRAALILKERGVPSVVFSARFLKPLDSEGILRLLRKYPDSAVVTMEDGVRKGGFGSEVLTLCAEHKLNADRIFTAGYPDEPVAHGTIREIYKKYGLDGESIAETLLKDNISGGGGNEA